ncbi:MAG: aminopeptidase [Rhodospirillales bacterium 70-18]|nr:D-aminopeptidase [Rhodospirillales bacterium]OJY70988.1 MAG: aminopeptidase [Rhodospirillales bacterium 70-18]
MNTSAFARLETTLDRLPERYSGPGGAAAVLRDGKVVASRTWGWADPQRRIPFTAQTLSLVCSITKQFTCALLLDQFPDPALLDGDVRRMLPGLGQHAPGTLELCHNQSGLRDYWALAMLCGAPVEGVFTFADGQRLIGRARTLHFAPGTSYSYVNQNFRILSDIIEQRTGQPYAELLRRRILDRAGMPHARLNPDTSAVAGGTVGHEGSVEEGFRPAVNRIHWTGDAGVAASLDDMIAWEQFIDATRDDLEGLYNRQSAPQTFRDGSPAPYGFGLNHSPVLGRPASAHGGGLRGWRSFRLRVPSERASVVVLFNHMADARAAALDLIAALLNAPEPAPPAEPGQGWAGRYLEPETGLAVRVEPGADHRLLLHYGPGAETLAVSGPGQASGGLSRLRQAEGGLWLDRLSENRSSRLLPCEGSPAPDVEGAFHAAELDATLTCMAAGGVLYGAFSGDLGEGEMHQLIPFARDIWLLPCPRALDYSAPGDWTIRVERDGGGGVTGLRIGCWLARDVAFARV